MPEIKIEQFDLSDNENDKVDVTSEEDLEEK